jgi:uncharacterized protein YciI
MFLLLLSYRAPLAVDFLQRPAHMTWLAEHYAAGEFLLSGRKEPRTGGVILANASTRADAEAICAGDPFVHAGVAEYEIVEFLVSNTAAGLEMLKDL